MWLARACCFSPRLAALVGRGSAGLLSRRGHSGLLGRERGAFTLLPLRRCLWLCLDFIAVGFRTEQALEVQGRSALGLSSSLRKVLLRKLDQGRITLQHRLRSRGKFLCAVRADLLARVADQILNHVLCETHGFGRYRTGGFCLLGTGDDTLA